MIFKKALVLRVCEAGELIPKLMPKISCVTVLYIQNSVKDQDVIYTTSMTILNRPSYSLALYNTLK